MEDMGRRSYDACSVICKHCGDENKSVPANGLCRECEEHMCIACFGNHKKYKVCKDHTLIDVDTKVGDKTNETEEPEDSFVACPDHMKEHVKFYCTCHEVIGCGDCMILNHKSCKVEYIADVSEAFTESQMFKDTVKQVETCQFEIDKLVESIKSNKALVTAIQQEYVADMKSFRDELILKFEKLEAALLEKANGVTEREMNSLVSIENECKDIKSKLTQIKDRIESNCSQTSVFIATIQSKHAMKDVNYNLNKIQSINTVSKYIFKRNDKIAELLKETELESMNVTLEDKNSHPDEVKGNEKAILLSSQSSNTDMTSNERQTVELHEVLDYEKPISRKGDTGKDAQTSVYEGTVSVTSSQDYDDLIYEEIPQSNISRKRSSSRRQSWSVFENQLRCENILMAGDIISFKENNKSDIGLFVGRRSVKAGTYFEVEIINTDNHGNISVGFIPKDYSLKEQPGDGRFSMGFHSVDGCIHYEDGSHKRISAPCKNGDVMGFGVCSYLSNVFKTNISIYVTKNSQKIGALDITNPSFCKLYPAVGLKTSGDKARIVMDAKLPH